MANKDEKPKIRIADPDAIAFADENVIIRTDGTTTDLTSVERTEVTAADMAPVAAVIGPLLTQLKPLEGELRALLPTMVTKRAPFTRTYKIPISKENADFLRRGTNMPMATMGVIFFLGSFNNEDVQMLEVGSLCERYGFHVAPGLSIDDTSLKLEIRFKPSPTRQ